MKMWSKTVMIQAPLTNVFEIVATPQMWPKVLSQITEITFLSEKRVGIGTRFTETRVMDDRKTSAIKEVVDFEHNSHVRIISKTGGSTWDFTFSTEEEPHGIQLRCVVTATADNALAQSTVGMIQQMMGEIWSKDLEDMKSYCEEKGRRF